MKFRMRQKLGH